MVTGSGLNHQEAPQKNGLNAVKVLYGAGHPGFKRLVLGKCVLPRFEINQIRPTYPLNIKTLGFVFLVMFLRIVPIRPPPCGEANPSNELPNKPLNGEGEGMKSMFCWIYPTVHL